MAKLNRTEKIIIIASIILALVVVAVVMLVYHNSIPKPREYDEEWIVGKTKAEIIGRYGDFVDGGGDPYVECYEILEDRHTRWGGTEYGAHLIIRFDREGKAYETEIINNDAGG